MNDQENYTELNTPNQGPTDDLNEPLLEGFQGSIIQH